MAKLAPATFREVARQYIQNVTFRSNVTPAISIRDPLGKPDPSILLSLVRPEITVQTEFGPQLIAPWGKPTRGLGTVVVVVTTLMVGWLAYRAFRKRR